MAVPKFYEFFGAFLEALRDGEPHPMKEVKESVAKQMGMSEEDLAQMVPSGKQTTFSNRVNWARTYLNKAGLITTPVRATYQITQTGTDALESGEVIDLKYLDRFDAFREFHGVGGSDGSVETFNQTFEHPEDAESPQEMLEILFKKVNNSLSIELMDEVMKLSDTEFEALVVRLLLQMGYGSGIDDAAIVTKKSNDGGIDGIIKEDQLGFSSIYIQAKHWATDRTITRPELQKFAGALQGEKATKGLFITTASFSAGAKEYADNLHGVTIVLVDGKKLAHLMIRHNLGVSVDQVYEIKKIDTDFFNDSL